MTNFFLSLVYECRFAIYIPLFLPISVPILFSSMAAFKWLGAWTKRGNDSTKLEPKEEVGTNLHTPGDSGGKVDSTRADTSETGSDDDGSS